MRSGGSVRALLKEDRYRSESAFALGALSHYAADACGHPAGTNTVTGLVFPELPGAPAASFIYAQAPRQYTQVELAFDAAQVRVGRSRSEEFHAAICG